MQKSTDDRQLYKRKIIRININNMNRAGRTAIIVLTTLTSYAMLAKSPCIVPMPNEYHNKKGTFTLTDESASLYVSPQSGININLVNEWLKECGIEITTISTDSTVATVALMLGQRSANNPEGYKIDISRKNITISAESDEGLIWSIQTLRQISRSERRLPCCSITDSPLYPWRSYLLDESRHFFGKESAKRLIDELSQLKINILHWHLTDGAGWRVEIPKYPLLTDIGSKMDYSHRDATPEQWDSIHPERAYYNAIEIREIVKYARDRGIKIVPEIDMPGHSLAAIKSYPWLGTSSRLAGQPVTGDILQVSDPEVEIFMHNVISYIIDLFETDIIHIGGDEVDFRHWEKADGVRAFMAEKGFAEPWQLQQWFVRRMAKFLQSKNCRMMGWNEITGHANDPVAVQGTITQFWEGDTSKISKAISQGYKVVNSAQLFTYLDYNYEGTPLWKTYRHHPSVTEDNRDIIGFGAQMWTEHVPDFSRLCYMTFPRLAALAECGWTQPSNKNYSDFIRRVTPLQQYWQAKGIIEDQPIYQKNELNAILPEKYRNK